MNERLPCPVILRAQECQSFGPRRTFCEESSSALLSKLRQRLQLGEQRHQRLPLLLGQRREHADHVPAAGRLLNTVAGRARKVLAEWPALDS